MDIEMPHVDGMKAAHRIREMDSDVILIFVTAMARYAIRGYEVDALDFVLKPVQYAAFSMKLRKVLNMLKFREKRYVLINTGSAVTKVAADDIMYVEVANHKLAVHTHRNVYYESGNIKDIEQQLGSSSFARCNSGYLVNLRNVNSIEKDECVVSNGDRLPVSRAKKKEFLQRFAVNDQETNRDAGGLLTWLNEQAMREIYLKGFELAVKTGNTTGIMSSFNRIGTTPTAESYNLLTTVLRQEWGFKGAVITDCVMACTTENIDRATLAGNDFQLSYGLLSSLSSDITGTVSGQAAMRQATKNILYMVANSDAPELYKSHLFLLDKVEIGIDIIFGLLFILYYTRRHKKMKRWKEWKKSQAANQ